MLNSIFDFVKEKLRLIPQSTGDTLLDAAIMAGPGNVKRKTAEQSSLVQWQVMNILYTFQGLNSFYIAQIYRMFRKESAILNGTIRKTLLSKKQFF